MEVQHDIVTKIKAIGDQRSGRGWAMTLDWMLPGSKYDLVLYGQGDEVEGFDRGDTVNVLIERGGLKRDKDGTYESDYFWNTKSISYANASDIPAPVAAPRMDDNLKGIKWGASLNQAATLLSGDPNIMEFDDIANLKKAVRGIAEMFYELNNEGPEGTTITEIVDQIVAGVAEAADDDD